MTSRTIALITCPQCSSLFQDWSTAFPSSCPKCSFLCVKSHALFYSHELKKYIAEDE